jgi:His-Xaa-Ser system radical SAM maturase HxsB
MTRPSDLSMLARATQTRLVPVRLRQVAGQWLLTNDFGHHVALSGEDLARLMGDKLPAGDPLWQTLNENHFVAATLDRAAVTQQMRERLRFVRSGPNLHIFVVTLRCNHTCVYCHASRAPMDAVDMDMDIATAERCVDTAFESPSPALTIEFQGGEPLANWPVVEHIIEYGLQKNALAGRSLMFSLVSNLSLMDDEKLDYLIDRKVQICTSLDGPAFLHDEVRKWKGGPSHDTTVKWMARINQRFIDQGLDPRQYRVEALPTVTRLSLPHAKEILDHYVDIGCRSIFLRHLDPFGWAATTKERLGYEMADFLTFYKEAYFHVVELNRRGIDFVERTAALFAAKIIGHWEPNFLDLRSPCGAGIGQIAYNHDGRLFTCDEGRMVDRAGDDCFCIGKAGETPLSTAVGGEVVRAMALASVLDSHPDCAMCAYKPYCGVCPVHNYCEQGSLHGRMQDSTWCQKHMGLFDFFFERWLNGDEFEKGLLMRWATPRALDHFVQEKNEGTHRLGERIGE